MANISVMWVRGKIKNLKRCSKCDGSLSDKKIRYKTVQDNIGFQNIKECSFCQIYYIQKSIKPFIKSIITDSAIKPIKKIEANKLIQSSINKNGIGTIEWYAKFPDKCIKCNSELLQIKIPYRNDKGEDGSIYGSKCRDCDTIHLSKTFLKYQKYLDPTIKMLHHLNPEQNSNINPKSDIKVIVEGIVDCYIYKGKPPSYCICNNLSDENKRSFNNEYLKLKSHKGNLYVSGQRRCPLCNAFYISKGVYKINRNKFHLIREVTQEDYLGTAQKSTYSNPKTKELEVSSSTKKSPKKEDMSIIGVQDFVVRSNLFQCIKNNHEIINIDAKVNVVDRTGKLQEIKVSAGYCSVSKTYFIMEHTYQYLKTFGIILCRITDNKTYLNTKIKYNGIQMAQESILMQYGYNVSSVKDLSEKTRRAILAVLVDHKVLSRTEITTYINSFIRLRKNNPSMKNAIQKWTGDRDFISTYRLGSYSTYGIKSLTR